MPFQIDIIPHLLQFKFNARTSRGAMQTHQVYYIKLSDLNNPEKYGIGECAPLPGLSPDYQPDLLPILKELVDELNSKIKNLYIKELESIIYGKKINDFPALVFALETAWQDLNAGGNRQLFKNDFSEGKSGIPINGLIWMGDKNFMQTQIKEKLKQGYSCLKLKIGSLDFDTELDILREIRKVASAEELTIRVDANGAFTSAEALSKLNKLAAFQLHSIEQPIRQKQEEHMQRLCLESPVPIALDEELIGITDLSQKTALLQYIKSQYIILKPTLVGGLKASSEWIDLAQTQNIGWWITSALESNIGLNAIAQFTANYPLQMEQGLGTGQLYHNNIASPLCINGGGLFYQGDKNWGEVI